MTEGADDGSVLLSSQLDVQVQQGAEQVLGFNENHTSILESAEVTEVVNAFLF